MIVHPFINIRYWNDGLIWFIQQRVLFLSSFTLVVDWSKSLTCLHFHTLIYSKYDIPKYILCFRWLYAQFMNTRLVMMSVSLHTETVLHCFIIQILHTRVWFLNVWHTSLTSVPSNLEHGLAILTESFSPLRSVLHNLSYWSPKQKWCNKPCYSLLNHAHCN